MEPTTMYGGPGRSPLRSKSPPKIVDDFSRTQKRDSPLRRDTSPNFQLNPSSTITDNEEQRYEERRGEELRRQIRDREAELAQISQSKDRLR